MINQETPPDAVPVDQLVIMAFFAGIVVVGIIYLAWRQFEKKIATLRRPFVIIMDLTTFKIYQAGVYKGINPKIFMPVQDGASKQMWGVETEEITIIPSFGNVEDVVIQDMNLQNIIVMVCQVIGMAKDESSHEEWCKDVFPPEIYDTPKKLTRVPENCLFVRPLGERNWIRSTLRQKTSWLSHVQAEVYKYTEKNQQLMQEMIHYYDQFFLQKIQSATQIVLSNWQSVLEGWDYTLKERTIPLHVMAKLLHVPLTKVAYSSLNTALSHGGFNDAAQFVGALADSVQQLAGAMNLTVVSAPMQRAITAKANKLQGELDDAMEQNQRAVEVIKQLAARGNKYEKTQAPNAQPEPAQDSPVL